MSFTQTLGPLMTRKMLVCVVTGFSSGLPLYLLLNLVPAWLRTEGVDLKTIGLFALIQLPYTWKFVWAPLLDRYSILRIGRRRGWMLLCQAMLIGAIGGLGWLDPKEDMGGILLLAAAVAIFSATQDIAIDAFRREILRDEEQGLGNSVHVNAYRIAGLVPGSLSLILADQLPWEIVFAVTATFLLPGMLMVLRIKEPETVMQPKSLREAVVEPFREFIGREGWRGAFLVLCFILLYKLGDSLCTALATPFYLDMGFTKTDIGLIAKHAGLWPAAIGAVAGGLWMVKIGINRALWIFGIAQALSIVGFAWLAWLGAQVDVDAGRRVILASVIGFEAFGVGLGTAAFVAYIARTTNPAFAATQFALFTSVAAIPRSLVNASAGWVVEAVGWVNFYGLCLMLTIPGLLLLNWIAPWKARQHDGTST